MLLRSTIPLLETSAVGAPQLRPQISCLAGIATQVNRSNHSRGGPSTVKLNGHPGKQHLKHASIREKNSMRPEAGHDGKIKRLTPYELAGRVSALCKEGNHNRAISLVKEAPLDAQNSIVWGSLISDVMAAGRYKEAYRLFIDMKRRGIRPASRTFSTLLKGYSKVENWEDFSLQLDNVCSLYDQVKQYHTDVQKSRGPDTELSNIPYNLLVGIFGKAQRFQRMYDVFNAMPSKGPLSPDMHTFTMLITAIGNRELSALSPLSPSLGEEEEPSPPTLNELAYKNASDAKLIWRQLLRVCQTPDSHAIRAVLKPLSRGRPSDQNFALDIVHEYLGLSRPGEQTLPAKLELHAHTLEALLYTCNNSRRYRFTLHYIQQVIDSDRAVLLSRKHMDLAMEAHAALATMDSGESEQALETLQWMLRMQALPPAPGLDGGIGLQIRPEGTTYDLVALACWHGGDWPSACRTFELMTGYGCDLFRGEVPDSSKPERRSSRRTLRPSAGFMSSFIRTAARTYDLGNVRLVLNIFEYYGWDSLLEAERSDPGHRPPGISRRQESNRVFYASKLLQALTGVLPRMLKEGGYDEATKARWKKLLRLAEEKSIDKPSP